MHPILRAFVLLAVLLAPAGCAGSGSGGAPPDPRALHAFSASPESAWIPYRSSPVEIELVSVGTLPSLISEIRLAGDNPDHFVVLEDGGTGKSFAPGQSCKVKVGITGLAQSGVSGATLEVLVAGKVAGSVPLYCPIP